MKKSHKVKLKYKKDRVLLSDVLPFELPITMSNRALYRFCVKNKIRYDIRNNILYWNKNIVQTDFEILRLIFAPAIKNTTINSNQGKVELTKYSTSPFVFPIRHKDTQFRYLSIPHPAMQIGMIDFYDQYKSLIIHYCSRSHYSLRFPKKVASYIYYKDRLHNRLLGIKKDKIELFFNEYENLKTFFTYKKYTQIYRFYDDYRFQRAEKRFQHLLRFDIQKCFDSIYTHTIAWATQGGKCVYKKSFNGKDSSSFGGIFDSVMQRLKTNETNGIIIGPEFSRIFAEVILQHIDRNVEYRLEKEGFFNGTEYQLYRYVDDYFLFYNEEHVKNRILELFNQNLEEYNLKIGSEKTKKYERPFLTEISQAKIRIDRLINERLRYKSSVSHEEIQDLYSDKDTAQEEEELETDDFTPDIQRIRKIIDANGYYPMNSIKFNKEYKDIILSVGVKPKDVLNYTLACIHSRLERELKKFIDDHRYLKLALLSNCKQVSDELQCEITAKIKSMESKLTRYLTDIVESSFFLFAFNQRITSSLKLSQLLNTIIITLNGEIRWNGKYICPRFDKYVRQPIFGQIQTDIIDILKRTKCHDHVQLEILYLLIIMREIDSTNPIPEDILIKYSCLGADDNNHSLNYIALNIILYYIGNKSSYFILKNLLIENIIQSISDKGISDYHKDTECILFLLDLTCCPYISQHDKIRIMNAMELSSSEIESLKRFGQRQKYFFTKWNKINVTKELGAKLSQEVYS